VVWFSTEIWYGFQLVYTGGSAMQLVMQALGSHRSTPEELEKLKELIRKLEEEGK
jgi:hypothetical protein